MKPNSVEEDYGEAGFVIGGQPDAIQRGRHWNAYLTLPSVPRGTEPEAVWAQIEPTLVRGGWTALSDPAGREKGCAISEGWPRQLVRSVDF